MSINEKIAIVDHLANFVSCLSSRYSNVLQVNLTSDPTIVDISMKSVDMQKSEFEHLEGL